MGAEIISKDGDKLTIQVSISLNGSMLEGEDHIQDVLNEAGAIATEELLEKFDTDGSPIIFGSVKYTARSKDAKTYQTPYGEVVKERYVYQTSKGGKIFCPLENDARIIGTSTPRFAKIVSSKYARMGSSELIKDLSENHNRKVVRSFVKSVSDMVGAVALAKEESWTYSMPEIDKLIKTVTVGLDGTSLRMDDGHYRQAMVGTIGLYDKKGERQHTLYIGASPEYGKENFLNRLANEVEHVKTIYSGAEYMGLADGARDNWSFLEKHTKHQLIDFYHAAGYVSDAADTKYSKKSEQREKHVWLDDTFHKLKNSMGCASRLLSTFSKWQSTESDKDGNIGNAVTYFTNNKKRMKYYKYVNMNMPIGSGVTEAACKVIIKERLCKSGMRWKEEGAARVISLRCLTYSDTRWEQFWNKINQYGYRLAA
ncbi:ISKra4 family transposase [Fibrobacterota bacterium]